MDAWNNDDRAHTHQHDRSAADGRPAAEPAPVPGRLTASQFLPPGRNGPYGAAPSTAAAGALASTSSRALGAVQRMEAAEEPGALPAWVEPQLHVVLNAPDGGPGHAKQRLDMVLATVRPLQAPARAVLLVRLEQPGPRDEIARLFQERLAAASRTRVLAALRGSGDASAGVGRASGTGDHEPRDDEHGEATAAGPGIQRKEAGEATEGDIHQAASRGVAGGGSALPHAEAIQHSFGAHDISGIQAHTGAAARQASRDIGAQAYATGNHVAFASAPDLHTAAHEAAHVVQQRAGVQLKGGVGEAGDPYERHADAVADQVVAGHSAEALLGQMAPTPAGGGAIQRKEVTTDAEITGTQDWTTADREGNTPRWQAACLRNLNAIDSSQYVKVVERRDFYHWFYLYSASQKFQTRWALAAYVVANGAYQIADISRSSRSSSITAPMVGRTRSSSPSSASSPARWCSRRCRRTRRSRARSARS